VLWGSVISIFVVHVESEGHFPPYLEWLCDFLVVGSCDGEHLGRLKRLLEDHVGMAVEGS